MARRSWRQTWSELFKRDVSREVPQPHSVQTPQPHSVQTPPPHSVQTPQRYVELARKCMEYAQRSVSTGPLQLNRRQCEHLLSKLKVTVQSAETCALLYSPEVTAESIKILKLLCRSAKEVETFIQSCCKDNWIQTAVTLSNMSEHVSSLSSDLDFCTLLLRKNTYLAATWEELTELDLLFKSESVKERVLRDQSTLLWRLEAINLSSDSSDEENQLVKLLSGRLNQHLSGSVELNVWEIDFSSMRQVQRLGSGSVGTVFKSAWLGAEVAEKMFYGSAHPRFSNEVEILAELAHPNIVPLLGYAMDESRCSIVMELMDADLLFLMEERLRENPTCKFPFTTSEAVDMMLQTAEGMLYRRLTQMDHENKVVHRDLKSQNILVKSKKDIDAEYMYAKVADFGLSKTKESSSSYSNLTLNTGTTRWMAPELLIQMKDDLPLRDPELRYPFKVDVYSFGMVCHEIMTGKVPFSGISSLIEVKKMVLNGDRPQLPDQCPYDLKILIHSCWESVASHRPSFVEICKRLRCVKYLLMRGSEITGNVFQIAEDSSAHQIAVAASAFQLAREAGVGQRVPEAGRLRQRASEAGVCQRASEAVRALTYDFTEMEPIGGSRSMFRANMGGGFVAVKKFGDYRAFPRTFDEREWEKQVLQIWKLDQKNVLKMIGCRLEEQSKVVVYEYAALGSLHSILHGEGGGRDPNTPGLTWMQRVKIAVCVARGLEFLHGQNSPIICGNITSSNILIFDDDVAKIGGSALLPSWSTSFPLETVIRPPWAVVTRSVRAPELRESTKKYSKESDIYDFGLLLLELLTGKSTKGLSYFQVRGMFKKHNVDHRISSNCPAPRAAKMAAVAGQCVLYEPVSRPSLEILIMALQPLLQP